MNVLYSTLKFPVVECKIIHTTGQINI